LKNLVLASASPRRKDLLTEFGFNFSVVVSNYNETLSKDMPPKDLAVNFATNKAKSVFENLIDKQNSVVLGADTIVILEGKILGKPKNEQDAINTLKLLSNNTHSVITGYSIISSLGEINGYVESKVSFNNLTEELILEYVKTGKPLDKAGSYGIQDGYELVKEFIGSKNNVIGLPIELIKDKLLEKLNENE
jgi:septum formation protein